MKVVRTPHDILLRTLNFPQEEWCVELLYKSSSLTNSFNVNENGVNGFLAINVHI